VSLRLSAGNHRTDRWLASRTESSSPRTRPASSPRWASSGSQAQCHLWPNLATVASHGHFCTNAGLYAPPSHSSDNNSLTLSDLDYVEGRSNRSPGEPPPDPRTRSRHRFVPSLYLRNLANRGLSYVRHADAKYQLAPRLKRPSAPVGLPSAIVPSVFLRMSYAT